jgi:hypothetical protein
VEHESGALTAPSILGERPVGTAGAVNRSGAPTNTSVGDDGPDVLGLAVAPLLTVAVVGLAAWPWLRAYRVPGAPALLAVATVVPVVITVVTARLLRRGPAASYGASLVALLVVVAAGISIHPGALSSALAHTPTRLLTETLPLAGSRALLLGPVVLVWVTGAVTAEVLARARRTAAVLLVPLASYVVAFAATAGAPRRDDLTGAWLLGALAALAVARARAADRGRFAVDIGAATDRQRRDRRGRRGLTAVVLAVLVAAGLGTVVPHLHALTGRQDGLRRRPPTAIASVVDPVDTVAALRDGDPGRAPVDLATVTTSAPSTGYLGIADLDTYDGAEWSFDSTFQPTGGRIPVAPAGSPGTVRGIDGSEVVQTYRLLRSSGLPLLPMLDRPTVVSGPAVAADAATGMVVPAAPLTFPSTYTITSDAPRTTLGALPSADAIERAPGDGAYLALPADAGAGTLAAVRYLATITGRSPTGSLGFLQAAVAALQRNDRRVEPVATGAHEPPVPTQGSTALAEVVSAVTIERRATPEQFATFLVVAARDLGIPARLVTGFRLGHDDGTSRLRAGTTTVTDRDAWTWAEVPVVGIGWVVVDPTPAATVSNRAKPPTARPTTATTLAPPTARAVPDPVAGNGTHAVAPPVAPGSLGARGHGSTWRDVLWILALIAVLLGLGPAVGFVRRGGRRLSRRSSDGAVLAVGAWLELLDTFDEAGLHLRPGATSGEVTAEASRRLGADVVEGTADVAAVADRALYAVDDPPDKTVAEAAWRAQRTIRRRVLASLDRRRRIRALVGAGSQPRRPTRRPPRPSAARAGRGARSTSRTGRARLRWRS